MDRNMTSNQKHHDGVSTPPSTAKTLPIVTSDLTTDPTFKFSNQHEHGYYTTGSVKTTNGDDSKSITNTREQTTWNLQDSLTSNYVPTSTEKYRNNISNTISFNHTSNDNNAMGIHLPTVDRIVENTTNYESNISTTLNDDGVFDHIKGNINTSSISSISRTSNASPSVYLDDLSISTQSNVSIERLPTTHNYTDGTNFTNINTFMNAFNSSTNETITESIQYFVPGQTISSSFDNTSTNYHHYFQNEWRENANVTMNESILQINDSFLFIPLYSDRSNSFISGMTKIDSSPETITKVLILALVSIFGSIGNFLVVGSVIKNRNLHRPPFYFLLSMGITDLARAGFCLPVVMATALQGSIWRHGDTACKMFAFAASFFVFSSTLSLLVISVERHLSIVHTKAYRRRCHGFVNLFATIFIWVTAFLVSFPPIFASIGAGEYVFISEEAQCAYDHRHFSHNDGLNSVLIFIGISSLTLFLYYRIFVFMRSHRRMRPLQHRPAFSNTWTFVGPGANGQAFINWLNGFGGNASNVYQRPAAAAATTVVGSDNDPGARSGRSGQSRCTQRLNFGRVVNLSTTRNEHLTRLFFIMTLVHGATWLPYVILSLWRVFLTSSNIPAGFITYAAWLSYSQVAICPLAYFLSRGRSKNTSRVIHMEPAERNDFLLENKIPK